MRMPLVPIVLVALAAGCAAWSAEYSFTMFMVSSSSPLGTKRKTGLAADVELSVIL